MDFVQCNLDDLLQMSVTIVPIPDRYSFLHQNFILKLKTHLLPRIREVHTAETNSSTAASSVSSQAPQHVERGSDQQHLSILNQVIFKGNCIYRHNIIQIHYTTYDL